MLHLKRSLVMCTDKFRFYSNFTLTDKRKHNMLERNNKIRLFLRVINNQTEYLQKCDVSIKETFKVHMHSHNLSAHLWYTP